MAAKTSRGALLTGLVLAAALPGCKPPPTDAAVARAAGVTTVAGPSAPLASPDTTGAIWAPSGTPMRLVYGVPGQPVLLALECLAPAAPQARLRITRHAPADRDAGALLALIGNGAIGRIAVDAASASGRTLWQGERAALDPVWEPLAGPREITATVPGAGLVRINPSDRPGQLLSACRGVPAPLATPAFVPAPAPPPVLSPIP